MKDKEVYEVRIYKIRKDGKDYYVSSTSDNPVLVKLRFAILWVTGDFQVQEALGGMKDKS